MASSETIRFIVLVKAAPVMTRALEETMCVAGVRVVDGVPEWIRLHPVPFRDLADESRFKKYQEVEVEVFRPKSDRRPESWSPRHGTIILGAVLDTEGGWHKRRNVIDRLPEYTMCDLIAANKNGSGPGVPSLAIVRPVGRPRFLITERDQEQVEDWQRRADASANKLSLFDGAASTKPPLEIMPWRFQYQYACASPTCNGSHTQTIIDWEVWAYWRRVRFSPEWRERMRRRFEDDLWHEKDSVFFVGNQEQHPNAFLILGVFWPPDVPVQTMLDF